MNARALIETFAREEETMRGQTFLAPLLRDGRARLRVRGMIHTLQVANARPGWWQCQIQDAKHAIATEEAFPWQRGSYLALWPALRLVLLEPLKDSDWLALPFNPSDAAERFGMRGPVVVRLVESGQPFERIVARVEGKTVWYDETDRRAEPATAERLRECLAKGIDAAKIGSLHAGERAAYTLLLNRRISTDRAFAALRTERKLRAALELGGARLIGYQVEGDNLRVTWENNNQRSITLVRADLGVVSAGICLSGSDNEFDLASIVGVVDEAPDYARWD